jgi:hypothetical protein
MLFPFFFRYIAPHPLAPLVISSMLAHYLSCVWYPFNREGLKPWLSFPSLLQFMVFFTKESSKKQPHLNKYQKDRPINLNKSFCKCPVQLDGLFEQA